LAIVLPLLFLGNGAGAQEGGPAGVGNKSVLDLAGCTDNELARNDDGSTGLVPLPFSPNFFGTTYTQLYVNNNGNVTFDDSLSTFTPFNLLSTAHVIIAPYFADVDTRSPSPGLTTYGATSFFGRPAFCVNWVEVGYFAARADKLNSFQLLLIDRSDVGVGDFDMMFNYDKIQWETGEASGGVDGLGGDSARVGYSNGVDTAFELPGSAVNGAFLDSNPGGLIHQSRESLQNGRYIFPVRNGAAPTGGTITGNVTGDTGPENEVMNGALVQLCRQGGNCITTSTNANGDYTFAGIPAGTYVGSAFPPFGFDDLFPDDAGPVTLGTDEVLTGVDFKLSQPRPVPPGVTIESISTTSTGAPVLNWSVPITLTKTNCPGGTVSYTLTLAGMTLASGPMTEGPAGTYTATIPALSPNHGAAVITITADCPTPADDKSVVFDVYIDPSGHVVDQDGAPIVGATVTLRRSDSSSGPFDVVPDGSAIMSPSNRDNPDLTDDEGFFHWDVIAGFYTVRAEADGCVDPENPGQAFVETEVLEIPPPALDLELRLQCGGPPPPTPTRTRTPTATPPATLDQDGDVNCDDVTNAIDAALVLQRVAALLSAFACNAGDVNEDGVVNSIDALIILQYSAGLIDELPV
jgi:hypothetical protein